MKFKQLSTPLNILLAEDDLDDRLFFEKALKEVSNKIHLSIVQDGEQLVNYLAENSKNLPDVLFLDLSMPRKTGFECLAEIKEIRAFKDIYIIMFSTSYTKDISYEKNMIETLYELGADEFIRKPSDFEELKQLFKEVLNKIIEKKYFNK